MSDKIPETTRELIRSARPIGLTELGGADPSYCAQIKLFARTQYAFYFAFQALFLAVAAAVAAALVYFIYRLTNGIDVLGVAGTLGSLATGTAAGFLQKAANDAKSRYDDARKELKEAGCG